MILLQIPGQEIFQQALENSEKITTNFLLFVGFLVILFLLFVFLRINSSYRESTKLSAATMDKVLLIIDNTGDDQREANRRAEQREERRLALAETQNTILTNVQRTLETTNKLHDSSVQTLAIIQSTMSSVQSTLADLPNRIVPVILGEMSLQNNRISEQIRQAFEGNPVKIGIMTVDSKGIVRSVNDAILELFGWREDKVLGKTLSSTELRITNPLGQFLSPLQYPSVQALSKREPQRNQLVGVWSEVDKNFVWVIVNAELTKDAITDELLYVLTTVVEAGRVIPYDSKRKLSTKELPAVKVEDAP